MKLQLGKTLKRLRREKDITQEELAEILGVSFQSVSRWELGVCYPDMALLPAIASFFNVTVDALLGIDDATARQKVEQYLSGSARQGGCGCLHCNCATRHFGIPQ